MPTVDCGLTDCKKHGIEICIAKRIQVDDAGHVLCYEPRAENLMKTFNSNCSKQGGKFKSNRVTDVLK